VWFGSSRSVAGWGGVELTETNFVGHGVPLGGAALGATAPDMPGSHPQLAFRLHVTDEHLGRTPLSVGAGLLYVDASEAYRTAGDDEDARPEEFTAVHYRRIGGHASLGVELGTFMRLRVDYRLERIDANVPAPLSRHFADGTDRAIDPGLRDGGSFLSAAGLTFERDTRADPVLTRSGSRLVLASEVGTRLIGSSYQYYKLTIQYQQWWRLRHGHVLSLGGLVGLIFGDAPIFERYYIGDLDPLVPSRALGLTLSTLPPRNLLGSGVARQRYAPLAGRVFMEYAVPLHRGGRHIYGADAFVDVGLVALANYEDLTAPQASGWQAVPLDAFVDAGIRLDTYLGIFTLSLGNVLGRLPW
jgi:outer membrane protein assembly factor BamA